MFIGSILELHADAPRRDIYLKYISERPGVEKSGANGLFTDEGVPIVLSQVQEEMNNHRKSHPPYPYPAPADGQIP